MYFYNHVIRPLCQQIQKSLTKHILKKLEIPFCVLFQDFEVVFLLNIFEI